MIACYTEKAASAGWRPAPDPDPWTSPATGADVCWTKTEQGRHVVLNVDFRTEAYSPAPEVGNGIAYEVSFGSTADGGGGSEAACWQ
ncbi:hypothetical protein [Streptomyces sp. NPDC059378]|uniref:hypothetical protein n=1 Tax=Streptomyces sp. NPDC059378 TaxID=3346815 RepID=UPI003678C577